MTCYYGIQILSLLITLTASACVVDLNDAGDFETSTTETHIHTMPLRSNSGRVSDAAPAGAHLTYFGGPLLTKVYAVPVFWNSNVQFQSTLASFYMNVPQSSLYRMLSQYFIDQGPIDVGPNGWGPVIDNRTATSVTDAAIHTELNRLFSLGALRLPDANTYYPVHFPAGVNIISPDGGQSCIVYCAYHGTYVRNGINVNYGVIPDQGGGCVGGCGANAQRVNNLTSVASYELVEATTDPAVGLATVFGSPLGWYDPNNGEIGDICNGQQGTTIGRDGVTYVVQTEFSNAANNCVTQ